MSDKIIVDDLIFERFLAENAIQTRIKEMARELESTYSADEPLLAIAVLNGSFVFAADLLRACNWQIAVEFVKIKSYYGTESSGKVRPIIGLDLLGPSIIGKHILIIEDIIDSGQTMAMILRTLKDYKPASVRVATLLDKPSRRTVSVLPDFVGFEIENYFVVGFGLDYNGLGRGLKHIYRVTND